METRIERALPIDFLLPEKLITDLDTPAELPVQFDEEIRTQAIEEALSDLQRKAERALKKLGTRQR
ncbi:MAG: hypothetical protein P8Y95_11695 [Gammaproteobacteria bacterium]